jgi:Tol biopolymer transport system component
MKRYRNEFLLASALLFASGLSAAHWRTFSIPDSAVLFATYNDLRVVTPDRTQSIKPPVDVGFNQGYFAYPSISPEGDLIAWGFVTHIEENRANHKARYALGIYSLKNANWKIYGDFDGIGATAFSPNGSRVAFVVERGGKHHLLLFDPATEALTDGPNSGGALAEKSLGWSPDGNQLAVGIVEMGNRETVALLDLRTGSVKALGEGFSPSWSPNGEWISYYDPSGSECLIARLGGTTVKVVRKLRQSAFSYRRFAWSRPVWSPDSRQILVTEMKGDGDFNDVSLIDIETGKIVKRIANSFPVYGWAPYKR